MKIQTLFTIAATLLATNSQLRMTTNAATFAYYVTRRLTGDFFSYIPAYGITCEDTERVTSSRNESLCFCKKDRPTLLVEENMATCRLSSFIALKYKKFHHNRLKGINVQLPYHSLEGIRCYPLILLAFKNIIKKQWTSI